MCKIYNTNRENMADQFRTEKLEALKKSLNAVKNIKQTEKPKAGCVTVV